MSSCSSCEAPKRQLWPPVPAQPKFERLAAARYGLYLGRCPRCSTLWAVDEYEAYLAFPYAVPWGMTVAAWTKRIEGEGPAALDTWHRGAIGAATRTLTGAEIQAWKDHIARAGVSHAPALPA